MLSFVHLSTGANIVSGRSVIDHPFLNGNPNARVMVTQARNDELLYGGENDYAVAPRYDDSVSGGRWSIFNTSGVTIDDGLAFHVVVAGSDSATFLHLTHEDNIGGLASTVSCPLIYSCFYGSGIANIMAFHTKDAYGVRGASFTVPTSVNTPGPSVFSVLVRAESSFLTDMKPGSLFWILLGSEQFGGAQSFGHAATAANINDAATLLDHPQLNGNPRAIFLVSKNLVSGGVQPEVVGAFFYDVDQRWYIYNEGLDPMTIYDRFSVFIAPILSDGFESGDASWWH